MAILEKLFKKSAAKVSPVKDVGEAKQKEIDSAKQADAAQKVWEGTVIVSEVTTEKSVVQKATNVHTFKVKKTATKRDVAAAIYKVSKIKPVRVNVVNNLGKEVRFGRFKGKRQDSKKAFVFLKEGDVLNIGA